MRMGSQTGSGVSQQPQISVAGSDGATDRVFRDALQLIAESITQTVSFGIACISVVRTVIDGTEELEVIADAGDDRGSGDIVGRRTPLSGLLSEVAKAEVWGHFRFLPHELLETQDVENAYGWVVPDIVPIDAPDAWHPLDLLVALLHDDQGVLRGTLAIDAPENGRRPGPEQRRLLENFAVQAAHMVVTTLEREELAEQIRLADTARTIVRNASSQRELGEVLAECQAGLVDGFRSHGSWIQTFNEDGRGSGAIYASNSAKVDLPDHLVELAERSAHRLWTDQSVVVIAGNYPVPTVLSADEQRSIVSFLDAIGIGSLLFVPLGAGSECLGNLVLTRSGDGDWTDLDRQAALDIGHDLGRVILNSRTFHREHELVVELQALDTYKSQLIATISHELKNPLTAVAGYLEMLDVAPELTTASRSAVNAMGRGAGRLSRVVDDLLLLSKVGDPHRGIIATDVDLKSIVDGVTDLVAVTARRKRLAIDVHLPQEPVTARGDATEIDRLIANLVSNAVKYTPDGRRVTIRVTREDEQVRIQVSDEGLGISCEDQEHLFDEFFRSTNPEAVQQPGTGLGLAIVKRIVERHAGDIDVVSELGTGSTFTVTLPAGG